MGSGMSSGLGGRAWLRGMRVRLVVVIVGGLGVIGVLSPASAVAEAPPSCSQVGSTVTCLYLFTGAAQSFVVPSGVQSIAVSVSGAQGGAGSGASFPRTPRAAKALVCRLRCR